MRYQRGKLDWLIILIFVSIACMGPFLDWVEPRLVEVAPEDSLRDLKRIIVVGYFFTLVLLPAVFVPALRRRFSVRDGHAAPASQPPSPTPEEPKPESRRRRSLQSSGRRRARQTNESAGESSRNATSVVQRGADRSVFPRRRKSVFPKRD